MADADDFAHLGMPTPLARVIAEAINDTDGGNALEVAEQALGVAEQAELTAADAQQSADDALDIVEDVSEALDGAVSSSSLALSTANSAASDAATAISTSQSAEEQVGLVYDIIVDANNTAATALSAAEDAQESADAAQLAADEAQAGVNSLDLTVRPDLASESFVSRDGWSPKKWTGVTWPTSTVTYDLPDHTYSIQGTTAASSRVVLPNSSRIISKAVTRNTQGTDYLFKIRVEGSGSGQVGAYIFWSTEAGSNSWTRVYEPFVSNGEVVTVYALISSTNIGNTAAWIRPGVDNNSGAGTDIRVHSVEVFPVHDWLNIFDFVQPGATDWSDAVDEAIRISALCTRPGWIDFKNSTFNVTRPIENTVQSSQWRNGIIQIDNNTVSREVFEGGSMDSLGVPRQKGIVRCMANFQKYDGIHLRNTGGPIMITTTNPAGWVVTEGRCVANGFEDVGTRGLQFSNLQVQNYDDYGLRYASPTGGGFRAISAHSRQRVTSGTFDYLDADTNRGYGILLDSNDGHVDKCVPVNGEFPIYQIQGGTIDLNMVHPWGQRTAYYRRYFGPASVPIRTGIQIRNESQIISFDAGLVTVTRDPVNWEVVVTPIAEILEDDATEVVIWRDAVNALLSGYNTNWEGAYFDGGSVRMTRPGHRFGDGCAGIAPSGGNVVALLEWSPAPARLTNDPLSQLWNVVNPAYSDLRAIVYPPLSGTAAPPVNIPTMQSWYGRNADTAGHFFSKTGTNQGAIASFYGINTQPRIQIGNDSISSSLISYAGSPEGNVIANAGSILMDTRTTSYNNGSAQFYFKTSSDNALGWRPVPNADIFVSISDDADVTQAGSPNRHITVKDTATLTADRNRIFTTSAASTGTRIEYHCATTGAFGAVLRQNTAAGTILYTAATGDIVNLVYDGTNWVVLNVTTGTVV